MVSIRRALFFICLLLITGPLVLFWVWPHSRLLEQETNAAREHHLLIARTLARTLERYHQDQVNAFNHVAEGLVDDDPKLPDNRLLRTLNVRHTIVVNRNTGARISSVDGTHSVPMPQIDPNLLSRLRALANKSFVATSSVMADKDGTPVFYLVRPAGENLVIAEIETGYLSEIGRSIRFGVNGHSVIVDHTGRALAHPDPAWERSTKDLSGINVVKRMLAGESGVGEFYSPAFKEDMIAGYAPVRGPGWGVMVPQPVTELSAAADGVRRHVFSIFASGLLIAALIAIRAGMIITSPLDQLNRGAHQMAAGNLDVRVNGLSRTTPSELATLTQSFNVMAEKLAELRKRSSDLQEKAEKANQSKTDFVRTVTHELRSPVNAILGFSELLTGRTAAKISPELRDSYLRDISSGARHLLSLVNDLLDLAKIESGQYELVEEDFWLDEITRRACRYVEALARERNIEVNVEFDGEPPLVSGDERALFQALLNLVSNAVRYGRRGGRVDIATRLTSNGNVEMTVVDDGPGIAAEDLDRVMLPFQRAQSNCSAGVSGTGLGLPIVKRFIELHGGSFVLSSQLGRGTSACITLPASRVKSAHDEPVMRLQPPAAGSEIARAA